MKQKKQSTFKRNCAMMLFAGIFLCAQSSFSEVTMLSLEKAIELGMTNSPSIKRTQFSLERSDLQLEMQKARLKSNISLRLNPFNYRQSLSFDEQRSVWSTTETSRSSASFRIDQPIVFTDGTLSLDNSISWQESYNSFSDRRSKTFDNNMTVSYTQPILKSYNATEMDLYELELDVENARYQEAMQILNLEQSITRQFYSVYQAKKNLEIAKSDLDKSEQTYIIQKNKVDAGLLPAEEMYQAEITRASSQLSYRNQIVSYDNTLDNFKQQLGISIDDSIDVDTDITHKAVEVDLDKALTNALKARMEIRQQEMNVIQAYNAVIRAKAENKINGDVTLSYGLSGNSEDVGSIYDNPTNNGQVNLALEIPIFDWGVKESQIKLSEIGIDTAELSQEDERISIILAIRSAVRELDNLVTQIDIEGQRVIVAQLTYDINAQKYANGNITSMDLSLVQDQLTSAKQSEISALINYKNALLSMKVISLWDFEKDEPVLPESLLNRRLTN
ncbi:TolC family protein [Candidatus Latescibacterota bacterium]